jgi:hypothetical protein
MISDRRAFACMLMVFFAFGSKYLNGWVGEDAAPFPARQGLYNTKHSKWQGRQYAVLEIDPKGSGINTRSHIRSGKDTWNEIDG